MWTFVSSMCQVYVFDDIFWIHDDFLNLNLIRIFISSNILMKKYVWTPYWLIDLHMYFLLIFIILKFWTNLYPTYQNSIDDVITFHIILFCFISCLLYYCTLPCYNLIILMILWEGLMLRYFMFWFVKVFVPITPITCSIL